MLMNTTSNHKDIKNLNRYLVDETQLNTKYQYENSNFKQKAIILRRYNIGTFTLTQFKNHTFF